MLTQDGVRSSLAERLLTQSAIGCDWLRGCLRLYVAVIGWGLLTLWMRENTLDVIQGCDWLRALRIDIVSMIGWAGWLAGGESRYLSEF